MAIPENEKRITLAQAANLVPRPEGKAPATYETVWRWCKKGVRGIKLDFTCVGGLHMTSWEAMCRFWDELAKNTDMPVASYPIHKARKQHSTPEMRQREIQEATSILKQAGIIASPKSRRQSHA